MLDRRQFVRELLVDRGDAVVVAGLGAAAYDVAAQGHSDRDFPLWGGMGGAAMCALGIALSSPGIPVLAITGDGEMFMGLGSLATIAAQHPANLSVIVLNNGEFGETGHQAAHSSLGADLAGIASASGFEKTFSIETMEQLPELKLAISSMSGCVFADVKVSAEDVARVLPPRHGAQLVQSLREALLGVDVARE